MKKLTINNPCEENWNEMKSVYQGRTCSACNKTVIDFSNMTDNEILEIFKNKKKDEKICGKFKVSQLDRNLKPQSSNYLFWGVLIATSLLFQSQVVAKDFSNPNIRIVQNIDKVINKFEDEGINPTDSSSKTLHGKVLNPKKEGIQNALLTFTDKTGKEFSIYTDSKGYFKVVIPKQYNQEFVKLTISHEDFNDFHTQINVAKVTQKEVLYYLRTGEIMVKGDVAPER